ncbi:MAG: hypothetical protein IAI49_13200 [Candidatus Eremiobacteraeota bacterium]|nr:hypothetical protein [Candidatus Eremiobacteraeota bacterium]
MPVTDDTLVIEETALDLEERPGPSPWLVLGVLGVILAIVFGERRAGKRRLAKREAIPTDIGDIGDSAFESRTGGSGT